MIEKAQGQKTWKWLFNVIAHGLKKNELSLEFSS